MSLADYFTRVFRAFLVFLAVCYGIWAVHDVACAYVIVGAVSVQSQQLEQETGFMKARLPVCDEQLSTLACQPLNEGHVLLGESR